MRDYYAMLGFCTMGMILANLILREVIYKAHNLNILSEEKSTKYLATTHQLVTLSFNMVIISFAVAVAL